MIKNKIKVLQIIIYVLLISINVGFAKETINVLQHGVKADGKTVNTKAIQKLIDEGSKNGGAIIHFPAGQYVAGTILIKDNVTLSLDEKAELLGSTNIADYQIVDAFRTGNGALMGYCFIGAVDAKNVGIIGGGTINGRGKDVLASGGKGRRPFLVRFVRTTGIVVKDVKLINSTAWTTHFFACKGIDIAGVTIKSRGLGNNDGFDIDCSQDVKIFNCDIDTGDDGLCFKTTWSQMACKNIEVKGLRITSNHGGIKFGTESMAPFENIKISDVYIYDTRNGGIKINSVDGAQIRDVEISNITMNNVRTPVLIRLGSRLNVFRKDSDTQQKTGVIENVIIRNVNAKAANPAQIDPPSGILITGVPGHDIKNLTLEDIDIRIAGGGNAKHARQVVPEAETAYPEISTFKPTIPAYGIWARHVSGLTLKNISFTVDSTDLRPAFIVEDGKNVNISNSQVPTFEGAEAVIRLENVQVANIEEVSTTGKAKALIRVEGKSANVKASKNKFVEIAKEIEIIKP